MSNSSSLVIFTDRAPALVAAGGERASYRFFEFFTANIRNPNTRRACAIGFAPSLFQPDRNDLDKEPTKNLHVGRVIYGDSATANRHRVVVAHAAEITSRVGVSKCL